MNNFLQKRTAPSCFGDIQLSLPRGTAVPSKPQGRHYLFLACWQAMQGLKQRNTYFAVLLCSAPTTSCLEKALLLCGTHTRTRKAPEQTVSHYLICLWRTEAAPWWQKCLGRKHGPATAGCEVSYRSARRQHIPSQEFMF